ncbi:MoxR family ATPase [Virgibacillus halophilus]|uniref:MoxR family ATPase n=1 Tax=Tigheibacillus halophilus TaxID=361280 RepID=A0ABU5C9R6_9BACI|nr:MoxR family ATPase [Virgibacillus halophilus]
MKKIEKAKEALDHVIYTRPKIIELIWTALLAKGHVLLESVPGTGKTKLAKTFAKVIDGEFRRCQFTPDVLPSDLTGIRFFNPKHQEFELRVGPVVTNILLADEINRATPKTQSSLLEVMEESQVTIDGETIMIDQPFMVLATQNPVESNYGTFPLPEAQLDRFLFQIDLGYPQRAQEKNILESYRTSDPYGDISSVLSLQEIVAMQNDVKQIHVGETVMDYLLDLVSQSRNHPDIELGISPRGTLAFMRAAQAYAYIRGKNFVTPADLKMLVPYVFTHRLRLTMEGAMKKNNKASCGRDSKRCACSCRRKGRPEVV